METTPKRWQIWLSSERPWGNTDQPYSADTYTDKAYAQSVADYHNEEDALEGDQFYVKEVKLYQVMPRSENS